MDDAKLRAQLNEDEGRKNYAYKDSVGLYTIGVGHLLGSVPRISQLTEDEIDAFLAWDINIAESRLRNLVPAIDYLYYPDRGQGGSYPSEEDKVRYRALVNMTFNLGNRLAGFKKFLDAVQKRDWMRAGVEMADSKWAQQVGPRAVRLRYMIETGKDPS